MLQMDERQIQDLVVRRHWWIKFIKYSLENWFDFFECESIFMIDPIIHNFQNRENEYKLMRALDFTFGVYMRVHIVGKITPHQSAYYQLTFLQEPEFLLVLRSNLIKDHYFPATNANVICFFFHSLIYPRHPLPETSVRSTVWQAWKGVKSAFQQIIKCSSWDLKALPV